MVIRHYSKSKKLQTVLPNGALEVVLGPAVVLTVVATAGLALPGWSVKERKQRIITDMLCKDKCTIFQFQKKKKKRFPYLKVSKSQKASNSKIWRQKKKLALSSFLYDLHMTTD